MDSGEESLRVRLVRAGCMAARSSFLDDAVRATGFLADRTGFGVNAQAGFTATALPETISREKASVSLEGILHRSTSSSSCEVQR